LTTRSDRFAVLTFFEARVERDTALGAFADLDPARDLELSLRFDLPPNVSSSGVLAPWGATPTACAFVGAFAPGSLRSRRLRRFQQPASLPGPPRSLPGFTSVGRESALSS
jgi:hypothetical protein